ncbi:extracellular solute-binding protein [Brevibacillus nitrificans]|uniref:ABC transporter substrate-binding protein n=1 Tax=Brevibacillus nitrificans TaxID=651560 RepID=UPI002E246DEC|nr:extracellular solute-binding protein [Brevibacillus nitrificans]
MKRMVRFTTGLLLVLSLATGCSTADSSKPQASANPGGTAVTPASGEQITLRFFHRWPRDPDKTYFEQVVKEFEKENPNIHIETEAVLNDAYKEKISVLLGTNNPPDIYFSWSGEYAYKFVRGGKALDLTNYAEQDKAWSEQLMESQLVPFRLDNKLYGVPLTIDGKTFFYNKEIFSELNLQVPKTWSEFISTLQTIKDNGYTPITFGNKAPWASSHYIGTLNQRMVEESVREKDYNRASGTFEDPGYVEALRKLQELVPYFNKDVNGLDHEFARQMFVDQKAAILYAETAEVRLVEPKTKFQWGFLDFPAIEGGKGNPNYLTGAPEGFMISSTTKHPDEAVKFLKFLTSKAQAEKFVKEVGKYSAVKGAVNENTATPLGIEAVERVTSAEGLALWLDTDLDIKIVDAYLAGTQQMLNGEKTPEDVLQDVRKAAQQVREQVK